MPVPAARFAFARVDGRRPRCLHRSFHNVPNTLSKEEPTHFGLFAFVAATGNTVSTCRRPTVPRGIGGRVSPSSWRGSGDNWEVNPDEEVTPSGPRFRQDPRAQLQKKKMPRRWALVGMHALPKSHGA